MDPPEVEHLPEEQKATMAQLLPAGAGYSAFESS